MSTDGKFFEELNKIVAAQAAHYKYEELLPTDWTVERMMEEHGLSVYQSRKVLDHMAKEGYFKKIKIAGENGGSWRRAYRPIEKKK